MDLLNDFKQNFKNSNILVRLIYINVAIFLFVNVLRVLNFLFAIDGLDLFAVNWLAVPSSVIHLVIKPWTLVTYMFLHEDIMHILFNMLWLFWFGVIFLDYLKPRQLLSVYILGGLAGAILFIVSFNIFPVFYNSTNQAIALGASASIMAIVIAISVYRPNYEMNLILLGPIKIKWIALISVILDIISIDRSNPGGHIAHLGGAIFGYYFASRLNSGRDITLGFSKFLDKFFKLFERKPRMRVTYRNPDVKKMTDMEYNVSKKITQEQIDKILDKISKSGYGSLTKDEKAILFNNSKKV